MAIKCKNSSQVKSTSYFFLLGFSSFIGYKYYNHYNKYGETFTLANVFLKEKRKINSKNFKLWISQNLNAIARHRDAKSEYFDGDQVFPFPEYQQLTYINTIKSDVLNSLLLLERSDELPACNLITFNPSFFKMGNLTCQYEPVLYNVRSGVSFANLFPSSPKLSPTSSIPLLESTKAFLIQEFIKEPSQKTHSQFLSSGNCESIQKPSVNQTNLHEIREQQEDDIESLNSMSVDYNSDGYIEDDCEALRKSNFDRGSFIDRIQLLYRLPPDGCDDERLNSSDGGNYFDLSEELKKPLFFQDDDDGSSVNDQTFSLTPNQSCDSIASDLSSLFPVFREDIGSVTVANIDVMLNSLEQVKETCLNLDEEIVHLKKDDDELEELEVDDLIDENKISSAENLKKLHIEFKGLLDTGAAQPITPSSSSRTLSQQWSFDCLASSSPTSESFIDFKPLTRRKSSRNFNAFNSAATLEWEEEFPDSSMSFSPIEINQPETESSTYNIPPFERIVLGQSRECSPSNLQSNKIHSVRFEVGDPRFSSSTPTGLIEDEDSFEKYITKDSKNLSTNAEMFYTISRTQENIGEKLDLISYSESEWRGRTHRAELIRKGYVQIPRILECNNLRRIRGDNYCAIRAALFQFLVKGLPVFNNFSDYNAVCQSLEVWINSQKRWLRNWSFGSRLPYSTENCISGFKECLESLYNLSSSSLSYSSRREEYLVDQFNSDFNFDLRLMEAVKLLMLITATKLYDSYTNGKDVPIFVILLFARDTSETPQSFMENHLNFVGDSRGLEQVEMHLLGYTLDVTLRIVRPSSFGSEDYICYYPERKENRPEMNLIAEDDRHYNIIVK